jgi:hypothetical protein
MINKFKIYYLAKAPRELFALFCEFEEIFSNSNCEIISIIEFD